MKKENTGSVPILLKGAEFGEVVLKSRLPVVVEFWSPGCGPCEMVAPVIEELASKFEGLVLFVKINVEEELQVAHQYGVLGAPTILFMKKGKIIHRINGYLSIDRLRKEVAKFAAGASIG